MKIRSRGLRMLATLFLVWWITLAFIVILGIFFNDFLIGALIGFPIGAILAIMISLKLRPN
jgi:hypothetical protein